MTSSNDKNNFLIGKLGLLNTKNVKKEQILHSDFVIARKFRVDTYLTRCLKSLALLTNLAKICHAKLVFQVKARQFVTNFMQELSKDCRFDLKLAKYLNFAVFKLEITNQ